MHRNRVSTNSYQNKKFYSYLLRLQLILYDLLENDLALQEDYLFENIISAFKVFFFIPEKYQIDLYNWKTLLSFDVNILVGISTFALQKRVISYCLIS